MALVAATIEDELDSIDKDVLESQAIVFWDLNFYFVVTVWVLLASTTFVWDWAYWNQGRNPNLFVFSQ